MKVLGRSILVWILLWQGACGGGGSGNGAPGSGTSGGGNATSGTEFPHSQCTLAEARREVLEIFEELYLYNDEPAQQQKYAAIRADLGSYSSVDALLDDLRFQPGLIDRGFSYYVTREQVDQFFSAGEFVGFGFTIGIGRDGSWRLIDVFGGSPADLAGLARGDTLVAVNGVATAGASPNDGSLLGPDQAGVSRTFTVRPVVGVEREVTLVKAVVDLDPVPDDRVRVFDTGGRRVGYVFLRTFIEPADGLLRSAFAELAAQGIDDLILDLRYNGGGLVDTAEILASLMAGQARSGQTFFSYEYNDLVTRFYGSPDDVRPFRFEANALDGLEHVYYLTDAGSASASELVISGLDPYMTRSVNIGARTAGKPVGQWGVDYCNESMVLFVVTFRTVNVLGEADYYAGLPVDCAAPDDWDHPLGDPNEGRLQAALDYIASNGSLCTPPVSAAVMSLAGGPPAEVPVPIEGASLASKLLRAF